MKTLPKFFPTLIFCVVVVGVPLVSAQKIVLKSRDEFTIDIADTKPTGSKTVAQQPTLLPNMRPGMSLTASYLTSLPANLHVGVSGNVTSFQGWSYPNGLFDHSSVSFMSIGPTLVYRTWSSTNARSNKLNFFCGINPGLSTIKVLTDAASEVNDGSNTVPLTVNSRRFFLHTSAGLKWNVNNTFAISLSAGYHQTQAKSQVFSDRHYAWLSYGLGISTRLVKDKHYKYMNE